MTATIIDTILIYLATSNGSVDRAPRGVRHSRWQPLLCHLCVKLGCIHVINPADNDDMFILFICMLGEELCSWPHTRASPTARTLGSVVPQWRSCAFRIQLRRSTEIYVSLLARCLYGYSHVDTAGRPAVYTLQEPLARHRRPDPGDAAKTFKWNRLYGLDVPTLSSAAPPTRVRNGGIRYANVTFELRLSYVTSHFCHCAATLTRRHGSDRIESSSFFLSTVVPSLRCRFRLRLFCDPMQRAPLPEAPCFRRLISLERMIIAISWVINARTLIFRVVL